MPVSYTHLVKQPTAFAIITDNQTYANTKDAMHQYKTAVEDDGLADVYKRQSSIHTIRQSEL